MRISIGNTITLTDISQETKQWFIDNLTFINPKYQEALDHGRSVRFIEKHILMYTSIPNGIVVPRGMLQIIKNNFLGKGYDIELSDLRVLLEPVDVKSNISLRSYQAAAKLDMLKQSNGILVAPAGSGKTVMGLEIFASVKQRMLWLTHTKRLLMQVKERILGNKKDDPLLLNISEKDVGIIGDGKLEIGDKVTIALVQTLVRRPDLLPELGREFGLVIVDECLVEGSKILLLDGSLKDIKDIQDGDVTTFGVVSHKFERYTDKLIELKGSFGALKGTPTHRLPYIPHSALVSHRSLCENDIRIDELSKININDFLLAPESTQSNLMNETLKFRRLVRYNGILYRCLPVIEKIIYDNIEKTKVYDFTTEKHLFIANGILSSNCHHVPASTFLKVIQHFYSYYLYALTATPYRRDRLESLMFTVMGWPHAVIHRADVKKAEGIITPSVIVRNIPSLIHDGNDYHYILDNLVMPNEARSNMIAEDVIQEAKAGNCCIVICTRKNYCEILHNKISKYWAKTGIANGDYSSKHNEEQVSKLENNQISVLITTFELLGEGFDVKRLNRGFLALPFREKARVEQAVGRIQRTCEGKEDAWLYDYVDYNIGILNNQFKSRQFVYKSLGMKIKT